MQDPSFIYVFISFSVAFIVLGCMTVVYYSMRLLTTSKTGGGSFLAPEKAGQAKFQPVADVKSQHVAAITAAVMAATKGSGKILSITPVGTVSSAGRATLTDTMRRWRTAGIVEAVGRRTPPAWKR